MDEDGLMNWNEIYDLMQEFGEDETKVTGRVPDCVKVELAQYLAEHLKTPCPLCEMRGCEKRSGDNE